VKQTSIFRGLLLASLLAAPAFVVADQHAGEDQPMPGARRQQQHMDPIERTQKHLDQLEQKLHLKSEQQTAWNAYADAALARAGERAKHMQEIKAKRDEHHADMDTATRLEHMAQRMREHADKMQQMARDTRVFQQALSPEQQTIFDMYWKSHFGRGKMRRRPS
jgi:hypothetical protein